MRKWGSMSVISGHAIGSANTASYHVSRSLLLGRHKETWMLCDLLPAHGEDALVWKTPLINPCRSCGIRSRENQSTRIEAVSSLTELFRYWRLWKCRVRLSRASRYWDRGLLSHLKTTKHKQWVRYWHWKLGQLYTKRTNPKSERQKYSFSKVRPMNEFVSNKFKHKLFLQDRVSQRREDWSEVIDGALEEEDWRRVVIGFDTCDNIRYFFLAGCCMAQRLHCPGGRPSNIGYKMPIESNGAKLKKTPTKPRCSLPRSARV